MDLGSPYLRWERDDTVAWVTIDRPERRNALTQNMYWGIRRAVDAVNHSSTLRALVITGTGDVFAPGGDLGTQDGDPVNEFGKQLGATAVPFDAIRESRKPVVSMVNGMCMGGGMLIAMLSDIAIASDRAFFGAPELRRGVADAYHAAILPEHVGIAIARDMLFTGRRIDAEEAYRLGVIARVVPHERLREETDQVLHDLLLSAPHARASLKRIINARYGLIDKLTFEESLEGPEVLEGFSAFVEKRAPAWVPESVRTGRV